MDNSSLCPPRTGSGRILPRCSPVQLTLGLQRDSEKWSGIFATLAGNSLGKVLVSSARGWRDPQRRTSELHMENIPRERERKSLKPFLGADLKQLSSNTNWRNFTLITTYVVVYILTEEKILEMRFISAFTEMIFNILLKAGFLVLLFIYSNRSMNTRKPVMTHILLHHSSRL